jgi:putative endonuclease
LGQSGVAATVTAMTNVTQAVGAYGERLAVRHLVESGLVVLDRNWRSSTGEVDIVARDGDVLVFCEVKTRRGVVFGTPAEAVGPRKVARLRRLAAEWLAQAQVRPREVRFDVVSVISPPRGAPRLEHVRGAF